MLRITVCFKIVHDLEYIQAEELIALRDGRLDLNLFKTIFGTYDEAALETALRLADGARAEGNEAELSALTVVQKNTKLDRRFAQDLFAVGFDTVTALYTDEDIDFQPGVSAQILSNYLAGESAERKQIIIMGKQTSPGESGMVPLLTAGLLQLPLTQNVRALHYSNDLHSGVYVVAEAEHPWLRVATLREKLAAKEKQMIEIDAGEVNSSFGALQFDQYIYEEKKRQCRMIEGKDLEEQVGKLWTEIKQSF